MIKSVKLKNVLGTLFVLLGALSFAQGAHAVYRTNPMTGKVEIVHPDARWKTNPSTGRCESVHPDAQRIMNFYGEYEYH